MQFTLGMYGEGDFFSMKGVVEEFFEKIGMHEKETYDPNAGKTYLHPGRQANIIYDGKVVGYLGEVHPEVADTYGIGERAYVAVLDMPEIIPYATFDRKYTGIAKYPAVTRDISMVVPKEILVGQIEDVIEKKGGVQKEESGWMLAAFGSAIFAALTSILGKVGITGVESNLGTALRTGVVLIMAWVMVFVQGKQGQMKAVPPNELGFICLSGLATGASWLCYYKALQLGPASLVAPIDKLSILVAVLFSYIVFHERLSRKALTGLAVLVAGTLVMLV